MAEHVTIVAWVEDAPSFERKLNGLPDLPIDLELTKAPADDWIEATFTLRNGDPEPAIAQFKAAADTIGMPYKIDEVN